jgi:hypothetical protein
MLSDSSSSFFFLSHHYHHCHLMHNIFYLVKLNDNSFLQYWGLNSGPSPWAIYQSFFCDRFFQDRLSWTICPGWLWTAIHLISVSWVARIIGMSHWHLGNWQVFKAYFSWVVFK